MEAASISASGSLRRTRGLGDRIGDGLLYGLTAAAALIGVVVVFAIMWRVAEGAWPAIKAFHLSFLWHNEWNAVLNKFGARDFIIGTIVTSFGAMLLAAPLSIAIGLFLSELAPPAVRAPIGTLVDMLAAVPSVVIGLWGIYVLAPFNAQHVQPFLSSILGWIPIFANGQDKIESHGLQRHHRADDHGDPDHYVDLPRALHQRARPSSRRRRSGSARRAGRW